MEIDAANEVTIAPPNEVTFISQITAELRWVPKSSMQAADYKLQQAWEVTQYRDGDPWKRYYEWRDVPVVMNP